jgi:C-terminal processing protease CtpA/Prc
MSGAALIAEGPDLSVIKVLRVRPNSPASAAGLHPQDVIEAVDGKAIRELTKLKQLFRHPDKEYLLNVRRAEEIIQLKIKLRRLV